MKRILITSENSYLGNQLQQHLSMRPDDFQVTKLSLRDPTWKSADFSCYDCIFHAAGIAHANAGAVTADEEHLYYAVNRDLAIAVAQKAKNSGATHFIHMSSMIIFGNGVGGYITPDTSPAPVSVYGDSKLQGEQGVSALADDTFTVSIIRAPMVYGTGCKGNYPLLSKLAAITPIFPAYRNERSMLYIGNFCRLVELLIEQGRGGIFHPQNNAYVNTSGLVALIAANKGKSLRLWPCLAPMVSLGMHIPGKLGTLVGKAFGNQVYAMEMSRYDGLDYQITDLETSIQIIEGKEEEVNAGGHC